MLSILLPNQAGVIWISILVAWIVLGDWGRLLSRRNIVLAALFAVALFLVDIHDLVSNGRTRVVARLFDAIFLITVAYAYWAYRLSTRGASGQWEPNVPRRALLVIATIVGLVNLGGLFGQRPQDAGIYTNLGSQRWLETGLVPYSDPQLNGPDSPGFGAGAAYGPLLYVAHMPFQMALGRPINPPDPQDLRGSGYTFPPDAASQFATLVFYAIGLMALFKIVRDQRGSNLALGVCVVYASSPYVLGIGGTVGPISGLTYISHIAPASLMLVGLAYLERPWIAGASLAGAIGALFYPVFMVPLWLGWYFWRRRGIVSFLAGFGAAALVLSVPVLVTSTAGSIPATVGEFMTSTLGHQESGMYGFSRFSFWGNHPWLNTAFQSRLAGDSTFGKPIVLLLLALSGGAFFMVKDKLTTVQLAALTAMLGAAVQLWKTHAGGTYVNWFFPFLLIAAVLPLVPRVRESSDRDTVETVLAP